MMTTEALFLAIWYALACGPSVRSPPIFEDCFNQAYVETQWTAADGDAINREIQSLTITMEHLKIDPSLTARDEYVASYNAVLRSLHVWGADRGDVIQPNNITTYEQIDVTGRLLISWLHAKFTRDIDFANTMKQWYSKNGGSLEGFNVWFAGAYPIEKYVRAAQAAAARDSDGHPIPQTAISDLQMVYASGGNAAELAIATFDRRFNTPGLAEWLVAH